jgi:hypothetical protein
MYGGIAGIPVRAHVAQAKVVIADLGPSGGVDPLGINLNSPFARAECHRTDYRYSLAKGL